MPLQQLINDPMGFFMDLLITLPAILIALVMHEVAHGYVAYRCGDPTAKYLGRLSLNPLKHLDPLGTVMMMLAGIGWAKPVPVNPRNFRNGRRDDLLVSLAGITMNLILCLLFSLILQGYTQWLMHSLPEGVMIRGDRLYDYNNGYYYMLEDFFRYSFGMGSAVGEIWGQVHGTVFSILANVTVINLCLAAFNLLPIPPLDGYHVLNDLVLKKELFASQRASQIASSVLLAVVLLTDWVDIALFWLVENGLGGLNHGLHMLISRLGGI